ncbi:lysozyme [Qipengyuania gaetbuli]|uniref:lysozyme n=1 Tax=Qipengyuania gaetbuli TaxID=266952 RepID=UPI0021BD5057|nr:lysozyme [Qipengyuania gaetbuli]
MTQETEKDQGDMPPLPSQRPSSVANQLQTERIRALFSDYDRPLDSEKWTSTPHAGQQKGAKGLLSRIKRHRDHRKELKRARKAAQAVFGVKPRLSARKRATLMMGAGAMGLTAFTGPPIQQSGGGISANTLSLDDTERTIRLPAALLKASDAFKQALIEEEGVRYTVYRDVAGYPTVGVGHLVTPGDNLRVGDRIDEDRVLALLDRDLRIAEQGVRKLVGTLPLYQHEFDALLDLVYNVGLGNVSQSESPRLNEAIRAGDYEAIAAELEYTHAAGQIARGLEFRSERRAQIFMDASYDDPREI